MKAAELARRERVALQADAAPGGPVTMGLAVEAYIDHRMRRDPTNGRDAKTRLQRHLLADKAGLAGLPLAALTERRWREWHSELADTLCPATVTRLLNDVRAAMHCAWDEHHRVLSPDWKDCLRRGLKSGLSAAAPDEREQRLYWPDHDVRRVIDAAFEVDPDVGRLVLALAATGARFGQATRLTVADVVTTSEPRLMMPPSRKGGENTFKPRRIAVQIGADVVDALAPALVGRSGSDILFEHWVHRRSAAKRRRVPWRSASQISRFWQRALVRAGLAGSCPRVWCRRRSPR